MGADDSDLLAAELREQRLQDTVLVVDPILPARGRSLRGQHQLQDARVDPPVQRHVLIGRYKR